MEYGGGRKMKIRKALPSDMKDIAKVHVDSWKATYNGIMSSSFLNSLQYETPEKRWEKRLKQQGKNEDVFVAENTKGEIIGFASGGMERTGKYDYDGELYAIYTLEKYQGKGVGSKLVKTVANSLLAKGFTSMLVWVLAENPARHFYESFHAPYEVDSAQITIGDDIFEEIAYGWPDLSVFVNK